MHYKALIIIFCFGLLSCNSSKKVASIPEVKVEDFKFDFLKNELLSDVLDQAKSEDKLVYVDMSATWCVPCKIMKRDVYTDTRTADFFNENFVSQITDVEKGEGPDLGVIFSVNVVPTLLFLDHRGRVVLKYEGATSATHLVDLGKEALEKSGK